MAVGTAVYDAHSRRYAEQAQTRHPVTATVLEDSTVILDNVTYTVSARWRAEATEHTGSFSWPHFVKAGDLIDIWVDTDSSPVSAPAPASHAGVDARDGRDDDLAECGRRGGGADRCGAVATEPSPQC